MENPNTEQVQQQTNEVDLGQIAGLKSEAQPQEPVTPPPPPIITNEQFVNLIAPIVHDAACNDLPADVLQHLPSPAILKAVLDIIDFESATGLLAGGIELDPKKRLFFGLGATALWAGFVVFKANAIRQSLRKRGEYEEALRRAAEEKRQGYQEIAKEMSEHGAAAGNANNDPGS